MGVCSQLVSLSSPDGAGMVLSIVLVPAADAAVAAVHAS